MVDAGYGTAPEGFPELGAEMAERGAAVRLATELEVAMPGDRAPRAVIDRDGYAEAGFWVDLSDPVKAADQIARVLAAAAERAG
jgi:hypothetical protein